MKKPETKIQESEFQKSVREKLNRIAQSSFDLEDIGRLCSISPEEVSTTKADIRLALWDAFMLGVRSCDEAKRTLGENSPVIDPKWEKK